MAIARKKKTKNIPKNYPLAPEKYSRHVRYFKMPLLLRSLNQSLLSRDVQTKIKENQQESVLVGQKDFIATLRTVFVSKLRRYV